MEALKCTVKDIVSKLINKEIVKSRNGFNNEMDKATKWFKQRNGLNNEMG